MSDVTPPKKTSKIPATIAFALFAILPFILAIVAIVVPFATVILIVNMCYNKGRINFKPHPRTPPKKQNNSQHKPFVIDGL